MPRWVWIFFGVERGWEEVGGGLGFGAGADFANFLGIRGLVEVGEILCIAYMNEVKMVAVH